NRWGDYAFAYVWLALPGLFLTSAMVFVLATATRSMMGAYAGVAAFLAIYLVANAALADAERRELAALVEPFGLAAYGLATRYFTAAEANAQLPAVVGPFLWNRLIWMAVALGLLALAYAMFRFEVRPRRTRRPEPTEHRAAAPAGRRLPAPRFGPATSWAQLVKRTRFDVGQVLKSPAFV